MKNTSDSVKTGLTYEFLKSLKGGIDITISSTQAVSSGWSKGEAVNDSDASHVPVHRKVHYLSSNPKVAKVGKTSGKVTAVSAGTCKIYCFMQNGLHTTVSVKVR